MKSLKTASLSDTLHIISIEASLSRALPAIDIVGLAGASIKESSTRVKSALNLLSNSLEEAKLPPLRININLSPSGVRKDGSHFDLGIALLIMLQKRHFNEDFFVFGDNGSGKSTFLNIITGQLAPDSGTVVVGENTKFGYYTQNPVFKDTSLTVLEYIKESAEHLPRAHFRLSGLSLYVFHFCHIFLQFVLMHMLHNAVEETIHFLLIIFLVIGMFISIVKAIRTVVPQRVA